jgi:hypothetical protein
LNPGRRGGKPTTNRQSYGAASSVSYWVPILIHIVYIIICWFLGYFLM